jgi:hypothetical protein
MREMDRDQTVASPLQELTNAAIDFGLSSEEILAAMDEALHLIGTDVLVSEYLDALSGLLARRILSKERDARSDPV